MTIDLRPGLSGLTPADLAAWVADQGQPGFRVRQIADALWTDGGVTDVAAMRTLPSSLRDSLATAFRLDTVADTDVRFTDGGLTEKALHRLADGALVESVLMHYPARGRSRSRHTLCISSQAGCAVGCPFCATGELGFTRDLEVAEIVDQVRHAARRLAAEGKRLTNIVFMGMGEPLYNFDNVRDAVEILSDGEGLSLSKRRITVSTSGVVPEIERLGAEAGAALAISLHAVRDDLRNQLVPLNKKYPIAELLQACRDYPGASNARRITFEYVMLKDVNDSPADARELVRLLKGIPAKINLIPFNPWPGAPYECSSWDRIEKFSDIVFNAGYASPVRTPRGRDILAACGQLKSETEKLRARARLAAEFD